MFVLFSFFQKKNKIYLHKIGELNAFQPAFYEEVANLKRLEKTKNRLMQSCHVHSFTYDFHLRIVARYLVGGKQVSGRNT